MSSQINNSYNSTSLADAQLPADNLFAPNRGDFQAILDTQKKLYNYTQWYISKKYQFETHSGLKSPKALHLNLGE